MRTGALVGLPVGAAAGALLALLFGLTSSGVLGVAALAAIAGGVAGAASANHKAWEKPEYFVETEVRKDVTVKR